MPVGINDIGRTNDDNIIFSFVMNGGPVYIYLMHVVNFGCGDYGEYNRL